MWLLLAFVSAALLGFYDVAKKEALVRNAVLPVLWCNTAISTLLFLPVIAASAAGAVWFEGTPFVIRAAGWEAHGLVFLKAIIVLISWLFGYYGLKHLPLTIAGPIHATRPVMVLVGAMLLFGERLNGCQWTGVALALLSLFLLSRSGRQEGIRFSRNPWILAVAASAFTGALSGLYDKFIMGRLDPLFVQSWYNLYQLLLMTGLCLLLRRKAAVRAADPFRWSRAIPLVSLFLSLADLAYFSALHDPEALISAVSMIRRGSVVVSFACGAWLFHEKNLRAKALDLGLVLLGMIFLYIGSR